MVLLENLKTIFGQSPIACLILHPNAPTFTVAYANDALLKMTNVNYDDIVGKGIFGAFSENPDEVGSKRKKAVQDSLEKALAEKKPNKLSLQRYDMPLNAPGNFELKFWNCDTYPLLDENGEVKFIVQNPVDITERVIHQEKPHLLQNQIIADKNYQHPLFNDYPDGVYILDTNGHFLSANKALADMAECTTEELLNLSFETFVAPGYHDEVFNYFKKAIEGEIIQFETHAVTSKGKYLILQVTNIPIIINKEICGIYAVAKDITLKVKTEEELLEQRKQIDAYSEKVTNILESITDGFFTVDANWTVTYWNKEAERMLNTPRQTIIQKNLWELFDPDVHNKSYQQYKRAMADNVPIRFEDYFPALNTWFEVSAYPSKDGLSVFFKDITERKNIEGQVTQAMVRYRDLFNSSPIPMTVFDAATLRFLDANLAAVRHYGYSREEFLTLSVKNLIPAEDINTLEEIAHNASDPSLYSKGFVRNIKKSGEIIFVSAERNSINFNGIDARLVLSVDVTEKLKIEKALETSEQRFRSLVQNGSDLIAILDSTGTYKYVSPTSLNILGVAAEYFIGKNAFDFIADEDKERVFEQFTLIEKGKHIKIPPFRFKTNNEIRWVETIATDLTDEPAVGGIVANSRDVTQRIENELRLKDYIDRFNIVLKATSDIIWDWDLLTNSVIRNKGKKSIFSNNEQSLTHDWWNNFIHPEDKERVLKKIQRHIKLKKSKWKDRYRLLDKNGAYKFILDRGFLMYDNDGRAVRMIGAMEDITERENYIQAIKGQNTKLREIAWIQSHIVRAPLCRIMGLITLLNDPNTDENTRNEALQHLNFSSAELDDVIKDIIQKAEQIDIKILGGTS